MQLFEKYFHCLPINYFYCVKQLLSAPFSANSKKPTYFILPFVPFSFHSPSLFFLSIFYTPSASFCILISPSLYLMFYTPHIPFLIRDCILYVLVLHLGLSPHFCYIYCHLTCITWLCTAFNLSLKTFHYPPYSFPTSLPPNQFHPTHHTFHQIFIC